MSSFTDMRLSGPNMLAHPHRRPVCRGYVPRSLQVYTLLKPSPTCLHYAALPVPRTRGSGCGPIPAANRCRAKLTLRLDVDQGMTSFPSPRRFPLRVKLPSVRHMLDPRPFLRLSSAVGAAVACIAPNTQCVIPKRFYPDSVRLNRRVPVATGSRRATHKAL